jgi:uncharacterized protein involved in exopolysaccharide biosynthesis
MIDHTEYPVEDARGLGVSVAMLRRRKKLAILTTLIVFVLGTAVTFAWPTTYKSLAIILLQEPDVPEELVQTTVTTYAAQQVQYINQRVMTRSNLASIIEKFDLYPDKRRYLPTLLLTEDVEDQISMDLVTVETADPQMGRPVIQTIAFSVGFEHQDPKTAQQVANELVSLYMEENVRARTVQTAETSQFLTEEVARLDREAKILEDRLARFKEENEGSLPELKDLNLRMLQRTEDELMQIERDLNALEDTRILLDAQLAQIRPTAPMVLPSGQTVVSPEDQLKSLLTILAVLEGRYEPDHPDIIRARREIQALREKTGLTADLTETNAALGAARTELAKARETYSSDYPEVLRLERLVKSLEAKSKGQRKEFDALIEPDNPAYIQLTAQREMLTMNERALKQERAELQQRLRDYEQRLLKAPTVEQELFAMARQLETATARYVAIRDRQFGAEMGQALETQSKGERFVLVEPPDLPLEPSSPNRPALLLLLLVLSPAAGFGMVKLRDSMDHSIWDAGDLEAVQGTPAIAEIPLIMTRRDQAKRRRARTAAIAGVPAAVLILAIIVHFAVRPLDVIWYVVLRKIGI